MTNAQTSFLTITGSGDVQPLDPAAASPAQLAERALCYVREYEIGTAAERAYAAILLVRTLDAFDLHTEVKEYIQCLRAIEAAGLLGVAAEAYCAVRRNAYAYDGPFLAARWSVLIEPMPWDAEELPFVPEEVHAA